MSYLQRLGSRVVVWVLLVAAVPSICLNIYLVIRIREVLAQAALTSTPNTGKGMKVGTHAPPFFVTDSSGIRKEFREWKDQQGTVLYVLRPSCIWCMRNEANIRQLAGKVADRYKFVGLSLTEDGLAGYLRDNPLPFPVYIITEEVAQTLGLGTTPETIVISQEGVVQQVWKGAFLDETRRSVSMFFGINL